MRDFMRYHHSRSSDLPLWRDGRAWLGRSLHWQWHILRPCSLLSAGFGRWRAFIYVRGLFGLHVVVGDVESDRGRWEIAWSDGALRFEHPWCRQDSWYSRDPWWRNPIRLRIIDWLIGRVRSESRDVASTEEVVPMPEGSYVSTATESVVTHRRRWYWPTRSWRRWTIEPQVPIPRAGKGENSWDCGDTACHSMSLHADNLQDAIGRMVGSMLRDRARYGHDSLGTGRVPVCLIRKEKADA